MRKIQSFVRRGGRLTQSQQTGLTEFWAQYGIDAQSKLAPLSDLFIQQNFLVLEVGFGNGDSLLEMAQQTPEKNFLGIEVYEAGVGRLISGAKKQNLTNLKVVKTDAVEWLKQQVLDDTFDEFQLFFPDPWHKKKHNKRRLVNAEFLDLLTSKLKNNAKIHMTTDWEEYAIQMMEVLEAHPNFNNTLDTGEFSPRPNYRPITKFEKRGEKLGHGVWDLLFTCKK
jgi:tRNA (guanine-N7-)-methyltransferase